MVANVGDSGVARVPEAFATTYLFEDSIFKICQTIAGFGRDFEDGYFGMNLVAMVMKKGDVIYPRMEFPWSG